MELALKKGAVLVGISRSRRIQMIQPLLTIIIVLIIIQDLHLVGGGRGIGDRRRGHRNRRGRREVLLDILLQEPLRVAPIHRRGVRTRRRPQRIADFLDRENCVHWSVPIFTLFVCFFFHLWFARFASVSQLRFIVRYGSPTFYNSIHRLSSTHFPYKFNAQDYATQSICSSFTSYFLSDFCHIIDLWFSKSSSDCVNHRCFDHIGLLEEQGPPRWVHWGKRDVWDSFWAVSSLNSVDQLGIGQLWITRQ